MRLMIFYPGGVSFGTLNDDATKNDILDTIKTAITIEEGNGNGRIRERAAQTVDDRSRE